MFDSPGFQVSSNPLYAVPSVGVFLIDWTDNGVLYRRVIPSTERFITTPGPMRLTTVGRTAVDNIADLSKIAGLEEFYNCFLYQMQNLWKKGILVKLNEIPKAHIDVDSPFLFFSHVQCLQNRFFPMLENLL